MLYPEEDNAKIPAELVKMSTTVLEAWLNFRTLRPIFLIAEGIELNSNNCSGKP